MELGEVHEMVDTAAGLGVAAGDRDSLVVAARASAGLRRWLDGVDLQIARAMAEVDARCELTLAEASRAG